MIDKKYEFYVFSLFVTMFMSFVISGVLVFANSGFIHSFIDVWAKAWIKAWAVAFPSVLIIIPIARNLVKKIIKN